jgi:Fe-S oxidoreductase/nitrate reductase gamma subunit
MTTESLASNPTDQAPTSQGKNVSILSKIGDFFIHVLGQVRVLKKAYPGIMHFLIFWGMVFLVIGHLISLQQMVLFFPIIELPFPRENTYLVFELIADLAGIALLVGLLMAAFRRIILRPKYLESRWDDYLAIVILGLIPVLGYFNEGVRIVATAPSWSTWSPIGNLAANLLRSSGMTVESAAAFHPNMVLIHVVFGLVTMASVPFTKLRHLVFTPINILTRSLRKEGVLEVIEDIEEAEILGVGDIKEFTSNQLLSFDACARCGRCEEVCPATISGMDYSPRVLIQSFKDIMQTSLVHPKNENGHQVNGDIFNQETTWACSTCGACILTCPTFVNPVDEVIDIRRYQVLTTGKMPKSVGDTLRNMERQGNPWGIPPQDRGKWAEGLNIRQAQPGVETDVLLFLGCSMAFDERNKKVARSIVKLLENNQIDYAYLGLDEGCCGETARRLGHEYLFQVMAEQNIELLSEFKFKRIVTQCAHCFNTIKNEYPQFGGNFEVLHLTQFLQSLSIDFESVSMGGNGDSSRVAYHDPCYLGRYNDVYEPSRELLDSANLDRVEMGRNKQNSFCCGGGGGQMWLETDAETRMNRNRLEEALAVQTDIIATACPYCLTMFDDAINSQGLGDQIKVMDISEILVNQTGIETKD